MAGGMAAIRTGLNAVQQSTGGISRAFSSFFPSLKLLKMKLAEVFTNGKTKAAEMFADAKAKFKENMLNLWEGFEEKFPNLAKFLVNVKKAFSTTKANIKEFFGNLGEDWDNFKENITTFSLSSWVSNRKDEFFAWLNDIKIGAIQTWTDIKTQVSNLIPDWMKNFSIGGAVSSAGGWLSSVTGIGDGVGKFAAGGIASGPTSGYPAMLHGREAVIPLSGGRSVPVEMRGGAGQVFNIKIDVSGVVDRTDKRALAREIGNLIQSEVARSMGGQTRKGRRA